MTSLWRQRPVGIVGLGLIGGSLALDLRQAGARVHAVVHRERTALRAEQRRLADRISLDPAVLQDCGLVILALPLDQLLNPDPRLIRALPADGVVTDVGSVKQPVLRQWSSLPRFVGSHPMAGTARAGVDAGEAGLFRGRPWVATPCRTTDPEALEAVRQMAVQLEARWVCCEAAEHDRAVALVSHLPVLVSAALIATADAGAAAAAEPGLPALARLLASSGFADTTRVGGGNPRLGTLMAQSNREAVLQALGTYQKAISTLQEHVLQENWGLLEETLGRCAELRTDFL